MTPPDHVGDDPVPHAGAGSQGLSTAHLTGLLNTTYARVIGLPNASGGDDAGALNALFTANPGARFRGYPGASYIINSPLYLSGEVDMTSCTITAAAGTNFYPVRAYGQRYMVQAPHVTAVASITGGTLAAASYAYQVSAVTSAGETIACGQVTGTVASGTTGSVALSWTAPTVPSGGPTITGYKVYGRGNGRAGVTLLLGSPTGTSFTDTGGAGSAATPPTTNATISRTPKLTIIGGTWDANQANRSCDFDWTWGYAGHCFDLQKVDDLQIIHPTVQNARKWAVAVADFGYLLTQDVVLNTASDGIHVVGPGNVWECHGTRGTTGDDMHGVSLAEWPAYSVSAGNIKKVSIRDIHAESVASFVRVLGSAGYSMDELHVDGVTGTYGGAFLGGVYVVDDQPVTGAANGTDIDLTVIKNINVTSSAGTSPPVRIGGRNMRRVEISNVFTDDTFHDVTVLVRGGTYGDTSLAVDDLTVRNVVRTYTSSNAQYALRCEGSATNIRRLVAEDIALISGLNGSTGVGLADLTIGHAVVNRPRFKAAAGSGTCVYLLGAPTIGSIIVRDPYCENGFAVLRFGAAGQTSGAVPHAVITGGYTAAVTALVAVFQTAALDLDLSDIDVSGVSGAGIVSVNAGVQLTMRGGRVRNPNTKTAITGTPASVRLLSEEFRIDISAAVLTKAAGDRAWNTNAALTSGAGPVLSDGTNWKHLYTAATY